MSKYWRVFALISIVLASLWNALLAGAAVCNAKWVLPRVAGGQFDTFPIFLRVVYGLTALAMVCQMVFAFHMYRRNGAWSVRVNKINRVLIGLSLASMVLNAMSRSAPERLNAVFAGMVAVGLWILG